MIKGKPDFCAHHGGKAAAKAMKRIKAMAKGIMRGAMMAGAAALMLTAAGCALRMNAVPSYSATAQAAVNPQLPPQDARREANDRAEAQARDQIMAQAVQLRLSDGRTLEDLAATDAIVRGQLLDTVRSAHQTDRTVTAEGVITLTLSLEKSAVQRIVDQYQQRGGK